MNNIKGNDYGLIVAIAYKLGIRLCQIHWHSR